MNCQFDIFKQTFQKDSLNLKELRKESDALAQEWKKNIGISLEGNDPAAHFSLSSDVAQEVKDYLLYLRNAYLEKIYAEIKLRSDLISEEKFKAFTTNQIEEYRRIKSSVATNINGFLQNYPIDKNYNHRLTHNPKETYSNQFASLKQQLVLKYRFIRPIMEVVSLLRNLSLNFP